MVPRAIKMRSIPKCHWAELQGTSPVILHLFHRGLSVWWHVGSVKQMLCRRSICKSIFLQIKFAFPEFFYLFLHPVIPSTRKLTVGISNRFANLFFKKQDSLSTYFSALYYSLKICRVCLKKQILWMRKQKHAGSFFSLKKRFFVETQNFRVFLKICVMACLVW